MKKLVVGFFCLLLFIQAFAQNEFSGVVRFDKTIHDFGDIRITDGEVKCKFTLTNISNKPIVIHRVISSCGCTEPLWTKKPIRPGEKGTIDVTFKNDQGPYPFDKAITTYISDVDKPVNLRIKGVVHEKKLSLAESFPIKIGGGMSIRESSFRIGQIEQGLSKEESFEVANTSSSPIKIEFTSITPGLELQLAENPIKAKSKTSLKVKVSTESTQKPLWGKNIFTSGVKVNGTLQKGKIEIESLIKENFSSYTDQQKKSGALPQFTTSSHDIGTVKAGEVREFTFSYKNIGKENLKIYKVESSEKGCTFAYPDIVAPNQTGIIKVKVDTKGCEQGELLHILTVVTNAPTRPLISLFITGIIK